MRGDMHKVLIKRPRGGTRFKTHRGNKPRVGEYIDEDSYARDLRPKRVRTRSFNDLLTPLWRWLHARRNQPWNAVWSEATASVDRRTVSGRHLIQHLTQFVSLHCFVGDDGLVYDFERAEHPLRGFYVDPDTGLLSWQCLRVDPPESAVPTTTLGLPNGKLLICCAGLWYAVITAEEVVRFAELDNRAPHFVVDRVKYKVVSKRQLSKRELKCHGLRNHGSDGSRPSP